MILPVFAHVMPIHTLMMETLLPTHVLGRPTWILRVSGLPLSLNHTSSVYRHQQEKFPTLCEHISTFSLHSSEIRLDTDCQDNDFYST